MARDKIHDAVKSALVKDGWTITADPYTVIYRNEKAFIDLAAEHPIAAQREGRKIAVEIKSFLSTSPLRDLETAIGQYYVYLRLLEVAEPDRKLFLAISDLVEKRFFSRPLFQLMMEKDQIPLLIVNVKNEEVVKWIS